MARAVLVLREAFAQGWVPLSGDGVRPAGPLIDLPADARVVVDAGGGRRVTLARSPWDGVGLHELAALAVLQPGRPSLGDLAGESSGRRAQLRSARSVHRVACGGARHTVRVDPDGPVATSHPEVDLESEAVAAALGVEPPACVQLLLSWPRRAAHLPERLEAARTLTRLAAWDGATSAEADVAVASWLDPAAARQWLQVGCDVPQAALWRFHGVREPALAQRFEALGCDPAHARTVLDTGVPLDALTPWVRAGTPAHVAALLVRGGAAGPGRLPPGLPGSRLPRGASG